jgi:hypothetical protein
VAVARWCGEKGRSDVVGVVIMWATAEVGKGRRGW